MFSSKCTDEYFLIIVLKQLVLSVQLISQEFLTIDEVAHSYNHGHCKSYKNLWLLERTQTWCTTPNVTAAKCTKNKITRIITGQMTSVYWWCHSSSALFHLIWFISHARGYLFGGVVLQEYERSHNSVFVLDFMHNTHIHTRWGLNSSSNKSGWSNDMTVSLQVWNHHYYYYVLFHMIEMKVTLTKETCSHEEHLFDWCRQFMSQTDLKTFSMMWVHLVNLKLINFCLMLQFSLFTVRLSLIYTSFCSLSIFTEYMV